MDDDACMVDGPGSSYPARKSPVVSAHRRIRTKRMLETERICAGCGEEGDVGD